MAGYIGRLTPKLSKTFDKSEMTRSGAPSQQAPAP